MPKKATKFCSSKVILYASMSFSTKSQPDLAEREAFLDMMVGCVNTGPGMSGTEYYGLGPL